MHYVIDRSERMKTITSRDNPTYRDALKLLRRKYRRESGMYLVEGVKPVRDALETGAVIERLFLCDGRSDPIENTDVEKVALPEVLFNKLSDTEHAQGVIAQVRMPSISAESLFDESRLEALCGEKRQKNILVMDRIQDPGNAGTMIRTAEAAGFGAVITLTDTVDIYSPKVVRSAAGSLFRMPVLTGVEEKEFIDMTKSAGWKVAVTTVEDGKDCFRVEPEGPIALVIGNEGQGISETILESADVRLMIPMEGRIESLNAAVAAGILMYRLRN